MKSLILLPLFLGALSAHAGTSILCHFQNRSLFSLDIQVDAYIPHQGFQNKEYSALVTYAGPRLHQESEEKIDVSYTNTRVAVGIVYTINYSPKTIIKLVNTWYNTFGNESFVGEYSSDGYKQALVCQYEVEGQGETIRLENPQGPVSKFVIELPI